MLTDAGQAGTNAGICTNVDWASVRPFFAKPNVIGCLFRLSVKPKKYVKRINVKNTK